MQTFSTLIHCCCSLSCPHLSFGSELHWLQLQFRFQLQLPGVPLADATATATATDANAFASSCQSQTLTGARWGRRELKKKKLENKQTAKNTLTNADNKLSKFCAYYPRKKSRKKLGKMQQHFVHLHDMVSNSLSLSTSTSPSSSPQLDTCRLCSAPSGMLFV